MTMASCSSKLGCTLTERHAMISCFALIDPSRPSQGHECTLPILVTKYKLVWRRQWHPTPVLLPRKSMDGGAWWAAVHGVAKSRIRLSNFTFTFHFNALEKEMATHSSILAWRIPGTEEPNGLLSMGSHRVGHD